MRHLLVGSLTIALAAASWGHAAKPPKQSNANSSPTGVEKKNVGNVVDPGVVARKVAKLTTQIHWHSSLAEARSEAQRQNKPIFWLHALGDLDGIS